MIQSKVWNFEENENAILKDPLAKELNASGHFLEDYQKYCMILDLRAHPGVQLQSYELSSTATFPSITTPETANPESTQVTTEQAVTIRGWAVDFGTLRCITLAAFHSLKLTKLSLWKCEFTARAIKDFMIGLVTSTHIVNLEIDCCPSIQSILEESNMENLINWIGNLQELSLRSNNLDNKHAKVLGGVLAKNKSLSRLTLWDNQIEDIGAIAIGEGIRNNRTLIYLSLAKNKIRNAGAEFLALSIGQFKLSPQQVFERKKMIRELEKKKKEAINRKRRVTKGKVKKQPAGKEGATTTSKSVEVASVETDSVSPRVSLKVPQDDSSLEIDMLITELEPVETEGISYSKGNRSIVYLNLAFNQISSIEAVKGFQSTFQINPVIQKIDLEANPFIIFLPPPESEHMPEPPGEITETPPLEDKVETQQLL